MTEAQLLDGQAFNRLVVERQLEGKTWEQDGYIYAGFMGLNGYELYRAYGPKWRLLYQARRINTQNAVGGGALVTRIRINTGKMAELTAMYVKGAASAGASLSTQLHDEDGAIAGYLISIGAGAARESTLPSIGSASTGHGNVMHSLKLLIGPGQFLYTTTTAALQTETLTIGVSLLLPIDATADDVVWDTTGSAGTPALAASTISAANTLQAVLLP